MVAGIAVDDVKIVDLVKMMLLGIGGEDAGNPRVETAAEQRHQPQLLKAFLVRPLPAVFELGDIGGLVIGGIKIMDAGFQTGIHDVQILVGEGDIDDHDRPEQTDQSHQLGNIVGIDPRRQQLLAGQRLHLRGDLVALRFGAAGQHDLGEFGNRRAFMGDNGANAAGANNQNLAHGIISLCLSRAIEGRRGPSMSCLPLVPSAFCLVPLPTIPASSAGRGRRRPGRRGGRRCGRRPRHPTRCPAPAPLRSGQSR